MGASSSRARRDAGQVGRMKKKATARAWCVTRRNLMSRRVEALLFAVAANKKTRRRRLRPAVWMVALPDGSVGLFRPDGNDGCDGWRPRTRTGVAVARGVEYVHAASGLPFVHRFTPGIRVQFGYWPPGLTKPGLTRRNHTRISTRKNAARRKGEPRRNKLWQDINLPNSRGGTRTRDPGIMSAVL